MAQCRRRWTASEKARIVNETYQPARAVLAANSRRGIATVARAIGASRSALTAQPKNGKRGRKPLDDLLQEIRGSSMNERATAIDAHGVFFGVDDASAANVARITSACTA